MTVPSNDVATSGLDRSAWGPLVITSGPGQTLEQCVTGRALWLEASLLEHGAILFRGFGIASASVFQSSCGQLTEGLLDYVYRSTPRTTVADHVYTATEYRSDSEIPFHSENSYQRDWPMKLLFCCTKPADTGGETPLARTSHVTRRIEADVVRRFAERGVMYVRNYGQGVDLPWEVTFQTSSREDVETYCRRESITCEWLGGDRLRTRQVCHGTARHPVTGEQLWFNQAHLFHVSSLGEEQSAIMRELFGEAELPRHAYYGDGAPIEESVLTHVREAYRAESSSFAWQAGDLLLLDNMLVAHSRNRYTGTRQVLVAMAEPFSRRVARAKE